MNMIYYLAMGEVQPPLTAHPERATLGACVALTQGPSSVKSGLGDNRRRLSSLPPLTPRGASPTRVTTADDPTDRASHAFMTLLACST
jgi:hypothetical protein